MANKSLLEQFILLADQVGSNRKVAGAIESVRNQAPDQATIGRTKTGKTKATNYILQCMIDDLQTFLENGQIIKRKEHE